MKITRDEGLKLKFLRKDVEIEQKWSMLFLNSDIEKLHTLALACQKASKVEGYYDLIIDDNVVSFSTKEARSEFKKDLLIEEVPEEELIKHYTKSA